MKQISYIALLILLFNACQKKELRLPDYSFTYQVEAPSYVNGQGHAMINISITPETEKILNQIYYITPSSNFDDDKFVFQGETLKADIPLPIEESLNIQLKYIPSSSDKDLVHELTFYIVSEEIEDPVIEKIDINVFNSNILFSVEPDDVYFLNRAEEMTFLFENLENDNIVYFLDYKLIKGSGSFDSFNSGTPIIISDGFFELDYTAEEYGETIIEFYIIDKNVENPVLKKTVSFFSSNSDFDAYFSSETYEVYFGDKISVPLFIEAKDQNADHNYTLDFDLEGIGHITFNNISYTKGPISVNEGENIIDITYESMGDYELELNVTSTIKNRKVIRTASTLIHAVPEPIEASIEIKSEDFTTNFPVTIYTTINKGQYGTYLFVIKRNGIIIHEYNEKNKASFTYGFVEPENAESGELLYEVEITNEYDKHTKVEKEITIKTGQKPGIISAVSNYVTYPYRTRLDVQLLRNCSTSRTETEFKLEAYTPGTFVEGAYGDKKFSSSELYGLTKNQIWTLKIHEDKQSDNNPKGPCNPCGGQKAWLKDNLGNYFEANIGSSGTTKNCPPVEMDPDYPIYHPGRGNTFN